jgi:hypothetical protein
MSSFSSAEQEAFVPNTSHFSVKVAVVLEVNCTHLMELESFAPQAGPTI